MSDLRPSELPEAERAAIQRDAENRILRIEMACLLHFAGIPKLEPSKEEPCKPT